VWVRFTTDMRQETLFRGLVDCFNALGFVPWVLVFDNMKTVTSGCRFLEHERSLVSVRTVRGRTRASSWAIC
jgi:transposase